mgnify:CR=1 FL=1
MNLLIRYDLLLLFLTTLFVHGVKGNFFFTSQMGMLDYLFSFYLYIRIDRSTYIFTPEIFLQIVAVSTPMAMFYSEE